MDIMDNHKEISIRPFSIVYILLEILIAIFTFAMIYFAVKSLVSPENISIFDLIIIESSIVQFILYCSFIFLGIIFLYKLLNYKVIFREGFIIVNKNQSMQDKLELKCSDIQSYKVLLPICKNNHSIYQYIQLTLIDDKKKKIFIKPFTKHQVRTILEKIKELGGLENQEIKL